MRKVTATALGVLGAMALAPGAAGAATFENGRCTIPGTITFSANIGSTPQARSYQLSSDPGARCEGTLDGVAVSNRPVVLSGTGSGLFSCGGAQSSGGTGSLRFPNATPDTSDDPVVNFVNFEVVSHMGLFEFKGDGASSGSSAGAGELLTNANAGVIQSCATGPGIRSAKFGAQMLAGPGFSG